MSAFTLTYDDQRVAHLVFDLADEKVNKFSAPVMAELGERLGELAQRRDCVALVVTSAKPDIFIAGADIRELQAITTRDDAYAKARAGQMLFQRLADLPFPSLAVIDGACLGGGMEFALACTWRLVTDADKTSLGLPEVSLGILPGWGGTQRLPRLIGLPKALELILSGRPVNGPKALKMGLADACVARAFLAQEVPRLLAAALTPAGRAKLEARRARGFPARLLDGALGRPLVLRGARKGVMHKTRGLMPAPLKVLEVVRASAGLGLAAGLEIEARAFAELAPTPESKCLIDCFFAGEALKREGGKGAAPVRQAGVLGAGVMGGGIAWLFAQHEVAVRLKDIAWDAVAKGYKQASDYNAALVKLRKLTHQQAGQRQLRIAGSLDWNGFANLDVVVEAVVEDLGVKQKVLAECERHVRDDCMLCSNTSSLSISAMGSALARPERFLGMHFFNPVNRMPLVEIIPGERTAPETVAAAVALTRRLGKTAVVVKDCPGFLVNRILLPYMNEAARLLQEGGEVEAIDAVIYRYGMPMGPFTLTDEVGIDVGYKVAKILAHGYGERMQVAEVLGRVSDELKLLGAKGGRGFYIHEAGKRPRINPDIDQAVAGVRGDLGITARDIGEDEILDRCLLTMVNEAARCLEEGVIARAELLDLAMVMGTGYPPQRGGPLHHADRLGVRTVVERLQRLSERHGMRFQPCDLLVGMAASGASFCSGEPAAAPRLAAAAPALPQTA